MPVRVIGGTIPTAFYTYTSVQNASAAAFTFSASTGTASTRKTIAVFVRVNGVISSVVINGVAIAPASTFGPSLYIAAAPTGTTATVTVNMSAVLAYTCTVTVFAVYDLASIVPLGLTTSVASPAVLDITVPNRGVVLALACSGNSGATYTWTGLTRDFQQVSGASDIPRSGAHIAVVAAGAPLVVRCAYSAILSPRAVAVSLR